MPPPGHEPFLRAICAAPEDDTVRLVYADWLDENGDSARAEFIRLQIAQAGKPRMYDGPYFRAEALYSQHAGRWLTELPALKGIHWDDTFRRGFVDAVHAHAGKWLLAHHAAIFAAAPVVALTLHDAGREALEAVLKLGEIAQLTELYLARCQLSGGQLRVLTRCPALGGLRTLGLRGRRVGGGASLTDAQAFELAQTPHLPTLQEVYVDGPLTQRAAEALKTRFATVRHAGYRV